MYNNNLKEKKSWTKSVKIPVKSDQRTELIASQSVVYVMEASGQVKF